MNEERMKSWLEEEARRDINLKRYEREERNGKIAKIVGVSLMAVFALIVYITQTNNSAHYSEGWVLLGGAALFFIGIFLCFLDFTGTSR